MEVEHCFPVRVSLIVAVIASAIEPTSSVIEVVEVALITLVVDIYTHFIG